MSNLIDRQAVLDSLKEHRALYCDNTPETFSKLSYAEKSRVDELDTAIATIVNLPSVENKGEWIPVKYHEITDEERAREGYPREWSYLIDCKMPYDGQQILTTTKGGFVELDECYYDGYEYSLDSDRDWADDVIAWMPLPGPYKAEN